MTELFRSMENLLDELTIGYVFHFRNGVSVEIILSHQEWEYEIDSVPGSYKSGNFILDGDTVIDYDGVLDLPKEVKLALGKWYKVDL